MKNLRSTLGASANAVRSTARRTANLARSAWRAGSARVRNAVRRSAAVVRHPTRRVLVTAALIVLLPPALLAALIVVVESEWAEDRIERFASDRLGREVRLNEIDVRFAWPPRFHLQALSVANPEWARTHHLIDAHDLAAVVRFWPLFAGEVVIDTLSVARGRAGIEKEAGRATWRFGSQGDGESRFHLQQAEVADGWIFYRNAEQKTALHVHAKGAYGPRGTSMTLDAEGQFRGAPARGHAELPSIVLSGERAIRGSVEATVGRTSGAANGTFKMAANGLGSIDAELELRGPTLAALQEIVAVNLPDTPPYRLQGRLRHDEDVWRFEPFAGTVGDSDLRGTGSYDARGEKPMLRADLVSRNLDFNDLGPVVGAPPATGPGETASPSQKRQAEQMDRRQQALPRENLGSRKWSALNADVRLEALQVNARPELPITSLKAHLTLENSVLRLHPLTFEAAGGVVRNNVVLDGTVSPMRGELKTEVRSLDLSRLFPKLESMRGAMGRLYGRAELVGGGESVAQLLGTSDGEAHLLVSGGRISALLVELLGLDVAEALLILGTGNVQTPLRCAVADLDVQNGVVATKSFVIDTRDTLVRVDGTIDLGAEKLKLTAYPQPKDASLLSVRSPITVTGALRDPKVRPKAGPIVGRIAAAGLLALVNPLLAVIPFVETGTDEHANCQALLATAKESAN